MTLVLVAAVIAAVLCWPRRRGVRDRMASVTVRQSVHVEAAPQLRRPVVLTAALAVVAVVAAGGAWWWTVILVIAAYAGARARTKATVAVHDVALAADLMAACMVGGAGVAESLAAASTAVEGPLRELAAPVVDDLRRGSPPDSAWSAWLADERLAPVARCCVRSTSSGAAVAGELTRVGARLRSRERALVQERVARASVWVVLPLGLCFLPAFVAVGVVPLVLGLLRTLH